MSGTERDFYQVSLKLVLRNAKGEVLFLEAQNRDTYAGYYDFPGGRINEDEFTVPLPEIVRREVREEIGDVEYELNPKPVAVGRHLIPADISKHKRDVHVLYLLYEGVYQGGDITISHEHQGYKWLDPRAIDLTKYLKSGNLEVMQMYLGIA